MSPRVRCLRPDGPDRDTVTARGIPYSCQAPAGHHAVHRLSQHITPIVRHASLKAYRANLIPFHTRRLSLNPTTSNCRVGIDIRILGPRLSATSRSSPSPSKLMDRNPRNSRIPSPSSLAAECAAHAHAAATAADQAGKRTTNVTENGVKSRMLALVESDRCGTPSNGTCRGDDSEPL